MIAVLVFLIALLVGVVALYLAVCMVAGVAVGLYQLTEDIVRHVRKLPPRQRRRSRAIQPNRVPIPFEVRAAVWARDGGACVRCHATDDLTVDHITPRVEGGSNDPANLQLLCRSCNSRKGPHPGRHHILGPSVTWLWRADRFISRN